MNDSSGLQWHPAFFAALQIDLEKEVVPLQFFSEWNLTKKPLQIDVLVVKKESKETLKKKIGKLFRGHNIVEYKSEEDYLSVNDFYKVTAYACLYQSTTNHVLDINPDDMTITLASSKYPRSMVKHLIKRYHAVVTNPYPGIFYISGLYFPMQLWIIGKLSPTEALWVNSLRSGLNLTSEISALEHAYRGKQNIPNYAAAMDVIFRANQATMKGDDVMCQAMREMFAEEFEKKRMEGLLAGRSEGLLTGRSEGLIAGRIKEQITLCCKKLKKHKSIEQIADEMEASVEYITRISAIAQKYAPEYDVELIYQEFAGA